MNIFILNEDPYVAADNLCDKHKVKMLIETCQMLSAVLDVRGRKGLSTELELPQYPKAHIKHPCTIWACESYINAQWLVKHLHGISQSYAKTYPRKEHKLAKHYEVYSREIQHCAFPIMDKRTEFVQAMPDEYKVKQDAVSAYKNYYLMDKTFAKWKLGAPKWYTEGRDFMLKSTRLYTREHITP